MNLAVLIRASIASAALLLAGCASVPIEYESNVPLEKADPSSGYRLHKLPHDPASDGLFINMTFSGGGTRAAALAYGVLREMRQTPITWQSKQKTLLDEVDVINGVSGGSFPAAYYALYGERIFDDFEARFLRRNFQQELQSLILSWAGLRNALSPLYGRGDMLAEHLDRELFDGKTFADFRKTRPMVVISASDMSLRARFDFLQDQFDLICSDLDRFKVARAVAASTSLPVVFSPIRLTNSAGTCLPVSLPEPLAGWPNKDRTTRRIGELLTYQDRELRPNVHLIDGGLTDNLGVRGPLELIDLAGGAYPAMKSLGVRGVRKHVFIVINAESRVSRFDIDQSPSMPDALVTAQAAAQIPLIRYSFETLELLRASFERWRAEVSRAAAGESDPVYAPDADFILININLQAVRDPVERKALLEMQTTLSLTDEQVDRLLRVGGELLRESEGFQRLMRDLSPP
jgi:NTE family protein